MNAGDVLLADVELAGVELDVERGSARIRAAGASLEFEAVRATTLLSPWDGARGRIEHVKVLAIDAGEICLEVRVRYETVPRNYRVVCGSVRQCSPPAKERM